MRGHCLDEDLLVSVQGGGAPGARVWEPDAVAVVLGRSNRPEEEVDLAACGRDGVPVLRRRGGGGAVVLTPGCLVVSLARRSARPLAAGDHLQEAVDLLAGALGAATGVSLTTRGTGDLCVDDRKVLGSSAFSGGGVFFYQASLLVDLDLGLVERYLRHPTREPAYRLGRPHRDFLTTLRSAGCSRPPGELAGDLVRTLRGAADRSVVTRKARGI